MARSGAQPVGPSVGRRALLSLLCLALASGPAFVAWPAIRPRLEDAADAAGRGDARLLVLAGLLFAAAPMCCGLVWHHALARAGGSLPRIDACARYGVGSLVNSLAPAHLGDVARGTLLLEALPAGRRTRIVRCFAAVQGMRVAALGTLVVAASLPVELAPLAVLGSLAVALAVLGRDGQRLLSLALLLPLARVAAVTTVLVALGAPSPLRAAFAVVPAIELAGILPLTPGNIGVASAAAAMTLHAGGLPMQEALSAGIVVHAVETAAGICFGTTSALLCLARLQRGRSDSGRQRHGGLLLLPLHARISVNPAVNHLSGEVSTARFGSLLSLGRAQTEPAR